MRKNNRAARAARTLAQFFDVVRQNMSTIRLVLVPLRSPQKSEPLVFFFQMPYQIVIFIYIEND